MAIEPSVSQRFPVVASVATSWFPSVAQGDVRDAVGGIHPGLASHRLLSVFDNAGIDHRSLAMPVAWYLEPHSLAERSALAVALGGERATDAASQALAAAGVDPSVVDAVVVASTTVVRSPALDIELVANLGLRPDIRRVPVAGMASLGGASALAVGADLVRAGHGCVLVVAVELNSLAFAPREASVEELVTLALFSDGAAAVVLTGDGAPGDGAAADGAPGDGAGGGQPTATMRVVGSASHLVPDSVHLMGFDLDDHGLRWRLSPDVPDQARQLTAASVDAAVATVGWERSDIDHYLFHPGGVRVLEGCAAALGLPVGRLAPSLEVLAAVGNVSGVTVLAVLERFVAQGPPAGRVLLTAMGPGFGFEHVLLEVA